MYDRKSRFVMIVFDLTKRGTFNEVSYWIDWLKSHHDKLLIIYIYGNKYDLEDQREIEFQESKRYANEN
jgi:GTPase SAR1 family protein